MEISEEPYSSTINYLFLSSLSIESQASEPTAIPYTYSMAY
jgi:hypothetical protein